jgi:hypothetical protein
VAGEASDENKKASFLQHMCSVHQECRKQLLLLIVQRAMMDGGRDLPEMDVGDNERARAQPPALVSFTSPRYAQ